MKKLLAVIIMFGLVFGFNTPVWAENGVKIDINTASVEQLQELKNVGAKTAERIVAYRQANGPFANVDDLTNVKGIGEKILMKNQDRITVTN